MKRMPKTAGLRGYYALPKRQQDAIKLMFSGDLSDTEIGKKVGRKDRTIREWKNDPNFIAAQREYNYIAVKDYVPEAITTIYDIMVSSKYEMARITAANSILKLSGMLSDNSTPELDEAKARKANAEADIAEQKAIMLKKDKSGLTKIVFTDDLKPDKEDDTKQEGDDNNGKGTKSK